MFRNKIVPRFIEEVVRKKCKTSFDLTPSNIKDYPEPDPDKKYLLYFHVPFCESFCSFCSFFKIKYDPQTVKEYFTSLRIDIKKAYDKGYRFQGVYIGGGTPTLATDEVAQTIDLIKDLFDIKEVSCEANPNISDSTIETLKNRVDRLSIGVQSFEESLLVKSNRLEKYGKPGEMVDNISKAIDNFKIVSVDMIFNFYDQTEEMLLDDLRTLIDLSPDQIAYYPLMFSKHSNIKNGFGGYSKNNEFSFFEIIMNELNHDYKQVGSWSFTKKGEKFFDEYVINHDEYLGLGAGAFSYLNNTLYANTFNMKEYIENAKNGDSTIKLQKTYGEKDQLNYRLMLRLFADDFNPQDFKKDYGVNSIKTIAKELAFFKLVNAFKSNSYSLNKYGKYYAMVMMEEFYIEMNELRAKLQK